MSRKLSKKVSNLLKKAKESALLSVEVYNKPLVTFRSGGFIVLMCIAWTSLLHAIFEKNKEKYFYKKGNSSRLYEKTDGEYKAWSLRDSAKYYFEQGNPLLKNIEFISQLRNKIEHRFLPEIDSNIMSECQANILGFEKIITTVFGKEHNIMEYFFIPLQLSKQVKPIPKTAEGEKILEFIADYRNSIGYISNSQEYAFKVFVFPNVGNSRKSSAAAIEFIKIDENNSGELETFNKNIIAIKEKSIQVANQGNLKPGKVVEKIFETTRFKPTIHWHTTMWRKHKVREDKSTCNTKFCQYDEAHDDFVYTDEWVKFLIEEEKLK